MFHWRVASCENLISHNKLTSTSTKEPEHGDNYACSSYLHQYSLDVIHDHPLLIVARSFLEKHKLRDIIYMHGEATTSSTLAIVHHPHVVRAAKVSPNGGGKLHLLIK